MRWNSTVRIPVADSLAGARKALTLAVATLLLGSTIGPAAASGPSNTLVSEFDTADGQNAIYYLGIDGNLHELAETTALTWTTKQLTGTGQPPLAAGTGIDAYFNTIDNGNEVYYLGNVGGELRIEQFYASNVLPGLLPGNAVAPGSNLVGYIDMTPNNVHTDYVFYIGADLLVHTVTWIQGSPWVENAQLDAITPPTAETGSPLAGHVKLCSDGLPCSDEVFYIGTDQNVYELWAWSAKNMFDGWHTTNVTRTAVGNAPQPVAGSPLVGFCDTNNTNDAMFYVGPDNDIYELLFTSNAQWSVINLTQTAAPPPGVTVTPATGSGSRLAAEFNSQTFAEEVFFVDGNQNVWQLWAPSTNPTHWSAINLSALSGGAPAAYPTGPLTSDVFANMDHLFYIGQNDWHVHELWWNGSWHFTDDSTQVTPTAELAAP